MTAVTVATVARPLDEIMFADITAAAVTFAPTSDGGATATFADDASPLTADQIAHVRIRMMTADSTEEQRFILAWNAISANQTFLAIASPTNAQAVAQVQALTRQMDALIKYVLQLS